VAGRQAIDAQVQGSSLAFGDAEGDVVRLGELLAMAQVDDAFGEGHIDGNARAAAVQLGREGPFALAARASGRRQAINANFDLDGPADRLDQLVAKLRLDLSGAGATMTINDLNGVVSGSPLTLAAPLRIASGTGRLLMDGLDLRVGAGRLAGRLELSPAFTSGDLHLEAVPVGIFKGWLPAGPTAGTLSGSGGVTTSGGIVHGELALALRDLSSAVATGTTTPVIDADLRTVFGPVGTVLRITARDTGTPAPPVLVATLSLPIRPEPGSLSIHQSPEAALAGDVQIRADLARLAAVYGLSDQRLGGELAGDLRLEGSLSHPEILGELAIKEGIYEDFVTGTLISGISGRAGVSEGRTVRATLSGTPAGGGSIAAEGLIDLAADGAPATEFTIDGQDARLVAREDATATIGGRLTFRGGSGGGQLAGTLVATPVEIRLRDRLPPSVVFLPVIEINRPGGDVPPLPIRPALAFVAALDIEVDMPRRVFVRGRGVESEWAGGLRVGGTTATPTLTGEVHLARGDFAFAGKRFRLQEGVVSFTGGSVIDPLLDVTAEYRTSAMTAMIAVAGPVSDPVLVLSSQPPLPESEILAQVMFDTSAARLSAVEAVQLAAALDSLNRADTFTADALGSIRHFLGLDVMDVNFAARADRGPSLEVGRYFSDHIFVGARRGVADQTRADRVEVEIVPGLSLQSDILQDVEGTSGSIGLQFKHDY
jgi:translocation and assembly module TamB